MKIQTNTGEVELTAEMVCRGMVLQSDHWIQNAARDGVLTMLRADPARPECWEATVDESWCYPVNAQRFLGCDPTIATRADCERFGVHGDAAAHGFARLRDGGAVDVRGKVCPRGAVVHDGIYRSGTLTTASDLGPLRPSESFIGLDARHASPEDVRRLCCGAEDPDDFAPGQTRCTLAIGDHDEHEDIAHGVKWKAKSAEYHGSMPIPATPRCCPNCGGDDATCRGSLAGLKACAAKGSGKATTPEWGVGSGWVTISGNGFRVGGPAPSECSGCGCNKQCNWATAGEVDPDAVPCPRCGCKWCGEMTLAARAKIGRKYGKATQPAVIWQMGSATLGHSQAHVLRDGEVYRWQVTHLGLRIRDGAAPHAFDAHDAAGRFLSAVHDATAGIGWLARMFGLLFRIHDSTPAAKRAKREAPLVALVKAVPEGLDPIGWRAAALAVHEAITAEDRAAGLNPWECFEDRLRSDIARNGEGLAVGSWAHVAWSAYQRAISSAPKVERQRLTWKTRGPVLAVDKGDD